MVHHSIQKTADLPTQPADNVRIKIVCPRCYQENFKNVLHFLDHWTTYESYSLTYPQAIVNFGQFVESEQPIGTAHTTTKTQDLSHNQKRPTITIPRPAAPTTTSESPAKPGTLVLLAPISSPITPARSRSPAFSRTFVKTAPKAKPTKPNPLQKILTYLEHYDYPSVFNEGQVFRSEWLGSAWDNWHQDELPYLSLDSPYKAEHVDRGRDIVPREMGHWMVDCGDMDMEFCRAGLKAVDIKRERNVPKHELDVLGLEGNYSIEFLEEEDWEGFIVQ